MLWVFFYTFASHSEVIRVAHTGAIYCKKNPYISHRNNMATEMIQEAVHPPWLLLDCAVQNYAWGKKGSSSVVAKLRKSEEDFVVDPNTPYAELWMGTHPKGPSTVRSPKSFVGNDLKKWLASNPWALGKASNDHGDLPFLFKVLSINKPLSIQAHPTKEHAKTLHSSAPDKYPDSNHKPEMAIAISQFEAFCGFRPISDIVSGLKNVPELFRVVGAAAADSLIQLHERGISDNSQEMKQALKLCFSAFINQADDIFQTQLSTLVTRLQSSPQEGDKGLMGADLLLRLHSDFPGDIGCFAVYFLNYLKLEPGEAIFLAPNEPHAYISGECMECMACSDNVVRAGLTPKFKDKKTLCEMLTYISKGPKENLFEPTPHPYLPWPQVKLYSPPVSEFDVLSFDLKDEPILLPPVNGPSILIIISGSVQIQSLNDGAERSLKTGNVLFIPAKANIQVASINAKEICQFFQAFCDQ